MGRPGANASSHHHHQQDQDHHAGGRDQDLYEPQPADDDDSPKKKKKQQQPPPPQKWPPAEESTAVFPPPGDHGYDYDNLMNKTQDFPPKHDDDLNATQVFPPRQDHHTTQPFPPPPHPNHGIQMGLPVFAPPPQIQTPLPPPRPSPAPVPLQLPNQPWKTNIFDCLSNPQNAILTLCFPCVTFGQIAEIADSGGTSCATSGMLYAVIGCCFAVPCLVSCGYRSKLRSKFGLVESPAPDWLVHCCCECCALCQEYRELQLRGIDPSIGWVGNVARLQQQQLAGMTPPMQQRMML